jgi:mannose-6-phosphate isomerase-like protein (cupin superfamily)
LIHTGETIENPITGERITFLATSADTDGEAVVIETVVEPHGFAAAAHVHPNEEERFEIVAGTLGLRVGGEEIVAGPGETLTVPAGTPHRFWNAGEKRVRFRCEVRPALQFEQLLETMFALAADGTTNKKGLPNPLRSSPAPTSTSCGFRSHRPSSSGSAWRSARPWADSSAIRRRTSEPAEPLAANA